MIYSYPDFTNGWSLDSINQDILNSEMTDKSVEWERWDDSDLKMLQIMFTNELSESDKSILDDIVEEYR